MRDLELVVRKYKEEDRQRVREICWNTASLGKSGDLFLDDKELLADLCCNYYTDHEKESVFVAEVCKKVVGYLFGCKDTKRYKEIVRMKIAPGVIGNILMSRHKIGRRTSKFFYKIVEDSLRYGLPKKPYGEYPAHLHINVEEKWRGRGIGKKLMNKYFEYLVHNRIFKVHLTTNSCNRKSVDFFYEHGFDYYSKRKISCFRNVTDEEVYLLTLVKKLE